ncbi:MAG: hypothetical protein AUK35_03860 [Zetaproteobacteria bacterium CG2_30_46_52]|nr:MAG: hypothetical protein AUK35_03860 [Zetaproteobacteria bacterium CG2_30_46_52]
MAPQLNAWPLIIEKLTIIKSDQEDDFIEDIIEGEGKIVLSFLNAHAANIAWNDKVFADLLLGSDILVRDGVGISILLRSLGLNAGGNLNGTDLIEKILLKVDKNKSIAVFGTIDPYLNMACQKIKDMGFSKELICQNGFMADGEYLNLYNETLPDIVILAMGMPKQERISLLLKSSKAEKNSLIINGGAIADFMAGRFSRAPNWVRKAGFEWFYRLISEPKRLWKRYLLGNFAFLFRVIVIMAAIKKER